MKKHYIALAFFGAVALSGCKDRRSEPLPAEESVPMQVNVKLGGVSGDRSTRAGAIVETAFSEGTKLGIALVDKDPAIAVPRYGVNASYLCEADYTVPDAPVFSWRVLDVGNPLMVKVSPAVALAYYPAELPGYATISSDKRSMTIELPETMHLGNFADYDGSNITLLKLTGAASPEMIFFPPDNIDFMTGIGASELTALHDKVQADITMRHAMAMVVVRMTSPADAPNQYDMVSGLSIENIAPTGGPLCNGTFALADNTFTPNPDRPIKYDRPMSGFLQGSYFGVLAFPATFGENQVQIVAKVGFAKYTYKLKAMTWESGNVYLYNINLKSGEGVLDPPVVIKDWTEQNENVELE